MKIALCCIGKMENDYALEFVEYYKGIGFDKIFIYDNNDINGEDFNDVIGDYVKDGFVEIINYRINNNVLSQRYAYHDCYIKNQKEYDWIAFFDFDEFLTLVNHSSIKDYLSEKMFEQYDIVHLNWMSFDDNDLLDNDGRKVQDRLTRPCDFNFQKLYNFPENNHIKSIIRCKNRGYINWQNASNPHTPSNNVKCCNNIGVECDSNSPFNNYNFDMAYIKHYSTKTIGEWLRIKSKRGLMSQFDKGKKNLSVDVFFKHNKKTEEKLQFIENFNKNDK